MEAGGNRYQDFKDGKPCYEDKYRLFNAFVNFDFVHTSKLNSLADMAVGNVDLMNNFMKEIVYTTFCHGSRRGWMK